MSLERHESDGVLEAVREKLAGRRLVWFGIRGEDGEPLLQLAELQASYSVIAPLRSGTLPARSIVSLEQLSGLRPDLDQHDIDLDTSEAAKQFRRELLREVSGRCVLMTYRPSALVSALAFSMERSMTLAGLFKDRQNAFEHKPWVETSLARRGVTGLGWHYVADEHRSRARKLLSGGPLVLRASRTSGGVGIERVETAEDIERCWPDQGDAFVAVAPFVEPTIPINFSGVVYADATVRLHPASVQLIGIPSCTRRRFGYCGNDFGALAELGDGVHAQIDALGRTVGQWLYDERYRGVFGVDALLHGDELRFTEINARFQGSSAMSASIAAEAGVTDLFLDHLAAMLGIAPPDDGLSIGEWSRSLRSPVSQIVVHNRASTPIRLSKRPFPRLPSGAHLAQVPRDVMVSRDATLCRVSVPHSVTRTGFAMDAASNALADAITACFDPTMESQ